MTKTTGKFKSVLNSIYLSHAFLLGCAFAGSAQAATIVHSNDILGEIEPCGCRSNPMGGMARKENALKKVRETDDSILQLDAGDLLFPSESMPELLVKQSRLQARYLLKCLETLNHDAVVPGEKDFALGLDVFDKLRKKSPVKFLAANLVKRKGGRLFESHAIFTRKGAKKKNIKIAVFGIVGDDLSWPPELKVLPTFKAAKAEVQALKGKADFIIALTHQGYEKDVALANEVPGIDIIIGGHTQSFLQKPVKAGKTWIYQSSFRNQYLGVIPLNKPIQADDYKMIAMDAGYDSPSNAPGKIGPLIKEFKTSLATLNSEQATAVIEANAPDPDDDPPVQTEPRFQTFPRCTECHLKQFDFWRKTPHVHALQVLVEKQQAMNKECLTCHTVGLGDPLGFNDITKMAEFHHLVGNGSKAEASDDLANKVDALSHEELVTFLKAMENAKNLKSEVRIRAGEPATSLRRAVASLSRSWTPVQCENCHQAGEQHPFSGTFTKKVDNAVCLRCHTQDKAPDWYNAKGQPDTEKIQAKRAKVTCPAGEMAPDEDP